MGSHLGGEEIVVHSHLGREIVVHSHLGRDSSAFTLGVGGDSGTLTPEGRESGALTLLLPSSTVCCTQVIL